MKAHQGRIARRAGAWCSVVELLESRALLSVTTLGTSSRLAPPDGSRDVVEVGSGAVTQDEGRLTNSGSGGDGSVTSPGPDGNGNVNVQDPTSVARNNADGITGGEALDGQTESGRSAGDITTPSQVPAGGGYSGTGVEALANGADSWSALQNGGDLVVPAAIAPVGDASSPGWGGPVISLTRRTRDARGLGNAYVTGLEHPGGVSHATRPSPIPRRDGWVLVPPRGTGTGTEIGAPSGAGLPEDAGALEEVTRGPGWADLLDGTASLDWEMLDGELRRFLSRVDGKPDAPDGSGSGMAWPIGLAIIAALLVADEAARGKGGWLRRIASRASPAGDDPDSSPVPTGPWPLGQP